MSIDEPRPMKSLNNDVRAYCTFVNRSGRTIYLFWLDFKGQLVRYGKIPPHKGMGMNTYVTHPWIARDADTLYPLLLNGDFIFYPVAEKDGQLFHQSQPHTVTIQIPVYPLLRRCLEVVYQSSQVKAIAEMEIPANLKQALLKLVPDSKYKDYKNYNNVWYQDFNRQ